MRILTVVAGVALGLLCARAASAETLAPIDNVELAKIIGESTAVGAPLKENDLPFAIAMVLVQEDGECDGTPQSCPTQTIYIALSEFGEYPRRKVFRLPDAHGWEFVEWSSLPKSDTADDYFEFMLKKQVPAADIAKDWWSYETYRVRANPFDASLERTQ